MDKNVLCKGNWREGNHEIDLKLPIILFKEDSTTIAYCPALDIAGYGAEDNEALSSFKITLNEFFKYTMNKSTFISEMKRLGWKMKRSVMTPPMFSKSLELNSNFSDIFNTKPFKKIDESVRIPSMI